MFDTQSSFGDTLQSDLLVLRVLVLQEDMGAHVPPYLKHMGLTRSETASHDAKGRRTASSAASGGG